MHTPCGGHSIRNTQGFEAGKLSGSLTTGSWYGVHEDTRPSVDDLRALTAAETTQAVTGHTLEGDARRAHQLSVISYLDDVDRPLFLDLGYRIGVDEQEPVLHKLIRTTHEHICIYEPTPNAGLNVPCFVVYKGTDDLFTLLKDLELMVFPSLPLFDRMMEDATSTAFAYLQNTNRNAYFVGHSLGALQAYTAYHRLVQDGRVHHLLAGCIGLNSFIQATPDIKEIWEITKSTTNPLASQYSSRLVSHIVDADIASLLLRSPETTFGQVFIHPNVTPVSYTHLRAHETDSLSRMPSSA